MSGKRKRLFPLSVTENLFLPNFRTLDLPVLRNNLESDTNKESGPNLYNLFHELPFYNYSELIQSSGSEPSVRKLIPKENRRDKTIKPEPKKYSQKQKRKRKPIKMAEQGPRPAPRTMPRQPENPHFSQQIPYNGNPQARSRLQNHQAMPGFGSNGVQVPPGLPHTRPMQTNSNGPQMNKIRPPNGQQPPGPPGLTSSGQPNMGQRLLNGGQFNMGQRPPNGSQPNMGQQPPNGGQLNMGQRPSIGGQPNMGHQPSIGGQPNMGQRPPIGGQPDMGQRPPIGTRLPLQNSNSGHHVGPHNMVQQQRLPPGPNMVSPMGLPGMSNHSGPGLRPQVSGGKPYHIQHHAQNMKQAGQSISSNGDTEISDTVPPSKNTAVLNQTASNNGTRKLTITNNQDKFEVVKSVMSNLTAIFNPYKLEGYSDIKLPQIVLCGAQGAGKTSVLERILGMELQTKQERTGTLCPIEFQLLQTSQTEKWAEFSHLPKSRFSMDKVKGVIDSLLASIRETGELISENPIVVRIYSNNIVPLNIVDLPGLLENGVQYGQPSELKERVYQLMSKYFNNRNSLIIFVASALSNVDASKSLRLALKANPSGDRIIALLTGLDMVHADLESKAVDLLNGNLAGEYKHPFIGLANRMKPQPKNRDEQYKYSARKVDEDEDQLLQQRFPLLHSHSGKKYFISCLSTMILTSMMDVLQQMKQTVDRQIDQHEQTLQEFDNSNLTDNNKIDAMAQHLTKFVTSYKAQIDGQKRNLNLDRKSASVTMKEIFDRMLAGELNNLVAAEALSDEIIDVAISNAHGMHSRIIISDDAFQELAKTELNRLHPLVFQCAGMIQDEMKKAIKTACDRNGATVYPKLYNKIQLEAAELISECHAKCASYLKDYLNAEACIARRIKDKEFRNKVHNNVGRDSHDDGDDDREYFQNGGGSSSGEESDNETGAGFQAKSFQYEGRTQHRKKVREEVREYFDVAKRDILEHVAKGITYKLIYGVSDEIGKFMIGRLQTKENMSNLMKVTESATKNRDHVQKTLNAYKEAKELVTNILENVEV